MTAVLNVTPQGPPTAEGLVQVAGTLVRHRVTKNAWGAAQLHVEQAPPGIVVGCELTIVGTTVGAVSPGTSLRIEGEVDRHPRFGPQLRVKRLENLGIRTSWAAANWLFRLDGVGKVLADRLGHAFPGDRILEVLQAPVEDGHPDPLTSVQGISQNKARLIRESWAAVRRALNPEHLHYLEGTCHLTRWEAQSVLAHASQRGQDPRTLLEQDPYSLTELKGWGFVRADRVALKAGMGRDAPARLEAATAHVLTERCADDGHTAVPQAELIDRTAALLEVPEPKVRAALQRLIDKGLVLVSEDGGRKLACLPDLYLAERRILRGALGQLAG